MRNGIYDTETKKWVDCFIAVGGESKVGLSETPIEWKGDTGYVLAVYGPRFEVRELPK